MGFLLYEELEETALGEVTRAEVEFTVKRIGPPLPPPEIDVKTVLPIVAVAAVAVGLIGVAAAKRKKPTKPT